MVYIWLEAAAAQWLEYWAFYPAGSEFESDKSHWWWHQEEHLVLICSKKTYPTGQGRKTFHPNLGLILRSKKVGVKNLLVFDKVRQLPSTTISEDIVYRLRVNQWNNDLFFTKSDCMFNHLAASVWLPYDIKRH